MKDWELMLNKGKKSMLCLLESDSGGRFKRPGGLKHNQRII